MKTKPRGLETWTSLDPNKNRSYLFETEVFFLQKKGDKMIYNYVFFIIQMKDFYFSDSINQEII